MYLPTLGSRAVRNKGGRKSGGGGRSKRGDETVTVEKKAKVDKAIAETKEPERWVVSTAEEGAEDEVQECQIRDCCLFGCFGGRTVVSCESPLRVISVVHFCSICRRVWRAASIVVGELLATRSASYPSSDDAAVGASRYGWGPRSVHTVDAARASSMFSIPDPVVRVRGMVADGHFFFSISLIVYGISRSSRFTQSPVLVHMGSTRWICSGCYGYTYRRQ